jgi:hypothetical protein
LNGLAVRRLALDVVLLAVLLWAADVSAASVVLVEPPEPSAAMAEALVRVRGELISEGFQVELLDGIKDGESRAWLEQLARSRKADAVVAVLGDDAPDSVEVWIIDRVTEKSVVRRIPFRPQTDQAPKTLAIHTLELLRASFLEIALGPSAHLNETGGVPAEVSHFVESERQASRRERFGVAVGGTAAMSFDHVGPAVLPVVRLSWVLRPSLLAQASVAGLGTRPSVQGQGGSAQVAEEFALLGMGYRFGFSWPVRPIVSLAAGALHTAVEGRAEPLYRARSADQWSFLVDVGLGVGLPVRERFEISLAAHAQLAEPYPAVRFSDTVVATSTRPSILLTLTLGAWL